MKHLRIAILSLCCISTAFSQEEDEFFYEDSSHLARFLQQVDYIELCELGLTCYLDTVYNGVSETPKVTKRCYLGGAIKYPDIDFSKITCRQRAIQTDEFFRLFILSTQNKTYLSGVCYQPRNGILFFDKNKTLLGYLEICFECSHSTTLLKLGRIGFNSDQYDDMETLFHQNGIKTK